MNACSSFTVYSPKNYFTFVWNSKNPFSQSTDQQKVTGGQAEQTQEDTAARGKAKQPIISALACWHWHISIGQGYSCFQWLKEKVQLLQEASDIVTRFLLCVSKPVGTR